jgi:hypothetical protein
MSVTPADGFIIMLTLGEIGIPMTELRLVEGMWGATPAGPLKDRVAQHGQMLMGGRDEILRKLDDVDARLNRAGLPEPTRPDNYEQYVAWRTTIAQSIAGAAEPAAVKCAALGTAIGDLLQSLSMQHVVRTLLAVAPDHERLTALDAQSSASRAELAPRVGAAAADPAVPEALREPAKNIMVAGMMVEQMSADVKAPLENVLKLNYQVVATEAQKMRALLAATPS